MSERAITEKASGFIEKYWMWILAIFGVLGLIAILWYFYKPKKETKKQ
jgi:hypothetical protein